MSKELMEDLLIEFDEMGFEPTTLCDNQREVESFRNRLKQVLDYLKAIDNANPSEALELLKDMMGNIDVNTMYDYCGKSKKDYEIIKQALLKAQEQEKVLNSIIEHLSFKYSGTEEYINFKTNQKVKKYMFEIESKDTGATIHIHLDTKEEFDSLKRWLGWKQQ